MGIPAIPRVFGRICGYSKRFLRIKKWKGIRVLGKKVRSYYSSCIILQILSNKRFEFEYILSNTFIYFDFVWNTRRNTLRHFGILCGIPTHKQMESQTKGIIMSIPFETFRMPFE